MGPSMLRFAWFVFLLFGPYRLSFSFSSLCFRHLPSGEIIFHFRDILRVEDPVCANSLGVDMPPQSVFDFVPRAANKLAELGHVILSQSHRVLLLAFIFSYHYCPVKDCENSWN